MSYVIAEPCLDCADGACVVACPADCIYRGERMYYIHPDECVTCGACEWACPVEAIYHENDVPDRWRHYREINAQFFLPIGSPGGARNCGPFGFDHPRLPERVSTAAAAQ